MREFPHGHLRAESRVREYRTERRRRGHLRVRESSSGARRQASTSPPTPSTASRTRAARRRRPRWVRGRSRNREPPRGTRAARRVFSGAVTDDVAPPRPAAASQCVHGNPRRRHRVHHPPSANPPADRRSPRSRRHLASTHFASRGRPTRHTLDEFDVRSQRRIVVTRRRRRFRFEHFRNAAAVSSGSRLRRPPRRVPGEATRARRSRESVAI